MSHYLSNTEKVAFSHEVLRTLKPGGCISLLHFSENEKSNSDMGRTRNYLETLFSGSDFEIIVDWKEIHWMHEKSGDEHSAWTAILRKKGGEPLKSETEFTRERDKQNEVKFMLSEIWTYLSTSHSINIYRNSGDVKKRLEQHPNHIQQQKQKIPSSLNRLHFDQIRHLHQSLCHYFPATNAR